MVTAVVSAGQNEHFYLGPSYFPGAPTPDTLNLWAFGGEASVVIATNNDPSAVATLNAYGGSITAVVGSHMTDLGTVNAVNGGKVAFSANWESSFNNAGTSIAASGGSIDVPINVVGKGLFLIEPLGTMTFASAFTPGNGFSQSGVADTQSVDIHGGTLVIDYLPWFKAPVSMDADGKIDINNLAADSATYDPTAHRVDFVGGGQVIDSLSVTLTAPGGTLKIAHSGNTFELTDPAPTVARGGHGGGHHHAWA